MGPWPWIAAAVAVGAVAVVAVVFIAVRTLDDNTANSSTSIPGSLVTEAGTGGVDVPSNTSSGQLAEGDSSQTSEPELLDDEGFVPPTPSSDISHVQWETFEVVLVADETHSWSDFPVTVTFQHGETGTSLDVDGFWDGGQNWGVRFAPPLVGDWTWSSSSTDAGLDGMGGTIDVRAPDAADVQRNPNYRGHLRVTPDQRLLQRADGTSFPVVGDTAWWFNSNRCPLSPRNATGNFSCSDYFEQRAGLGFNTIAIEYFNIHNENEGGAPFPCNTEDRGNGDYSCLNTEHFDALDSRMQQMWSAGHIAYGHVSWLVGQQPNEFTTLADAQHLSRYILARYSWMPMIFSLTGEYQYGYDAQGVLWQTADWDAYGAFVQQHNPLGHPVTIHPSSSARWEFNNPGAGQQSSAGEFHASDWLDINSVQSGQRIDKLPLVTATVATDYGRNPAKPVLHSEGAYLENIVDVAGVTGAQLRWQAYAAFLNGAAGHIYGANGIWQMYVGSEVSYPESPDHGTTRVWWEVMQHPSAGQVAFVRSFLEDEVGEWWRLLPRRQWLTAEGFDYLNDQTDPHLAGFEDNSTLVVFFGELMARNERVVAVDNGLAGRVWTGTWFNPRTGEQTLHGPIEGRANGSIRFPDRPDGGDWLLLLRSS